MAKNRAVEPEDDDEGARSFARTLEQIDDGHGVVDMSLELRELMRNLFKHARATNNDAKGSFTLKLGFKVEPNGITHIGYEMGIKTPKRRTGGTTMWLTNGGNLSVDNPKQQNLPLREVDRAIKYRDVENDTKPNVKDI